MQHTALATTGLNIEPHAHMHRITGLAQQNTIPIRSFCNQIPTLPLRVIAEGASQRQ